MPSAGYLIYVGVTPLLKTFIAIFVGFVLARLGLFPPQASKGASQVTMNIALPGLIFYNVVPAFTSSNISALGPLFLTAFTYQIMGFTFGLLIREFFYVPRNFWQGIVVLCGMSNWGNLPNAIVSSIMEESPFDPDTDPELGVSYVAIFIVSYHLVFWVAGAARSLAWDYLPGVPQGAEAERHFSWWEKPIGGFIARHIFRIDVTDAPSRDKTEVGSLADKDPEKALDADDVGSQAVVERPVTEDQPLENDPDVQLARRMSRMSIPSNQVSAEQPAQSDTSERTPAHAPFIRRLGRTLRPLRGAITPITCTLAVSLAIALIDDLKALFTTVDGGPNWTGPDGKPPLEFIMETADFLGNISVPMACILLGASFARMKIPRPLSRMPIAAMIAATTAKMVLLPVIGIFMVQAMVTGGLIPRDSFAEIFVAMFLSGTPAAVNQLIVSSLYSPDGDVDTLSAFLLVQYVALFFTSAALSAVAILLIE